MATTVSLEGWAPGLDEFGRPCWYHTVTRDRLYASHRHYSKLPTAASSNLPPDVAMKELWKQAMAGAWKECETDGEDGKKKSYWYNILSGETTWDKPATNEAKPPPPPAPPAKPVERKKPSPIVSSKEETEKDQWKQLRTEKGRKYWHNAKSGESQYDTPNCLRKYR